MTTSGNQLLRIDSSTPGTIQSTQNITGLQSGESVLGIDLRPANGLLYGLGSSSRIYTIDANTGVATAIGAAGAFTLMGTSFGFDFNPTVDRIRVVSNTSQDLRLNPNDGTLTATDGNLNGAATSAFGAGYVPAPLGGSTVLYDLDSVSDSLYIQNPANSGTLVLVGSLGLDVSGVGELDLVSNSVAFAALQPAGGGGSSLYSINLSTGLASLIGAFGNGQLTITGLAASPVPEPTTVFSVGTAVLAFAFARRKRR